MSETISTPQALEWFIAVAEAASFRKAADQLGVPVATLSRRIRQFEDGLGVKLFQRTTRQVALTGLGRQLMDGLTQPLAQIDALLHHIRGAQEDVAGTVRLTTTHFMAEYFLPSVVTDLTSRYPQLRLEVLADEAVVDMRALGIDIALRAGNIKDDSLVGRLVFRSVFHRYAAPKWVNQPRIPHLAYHDEPNLQQAQLVCGNMRTVFACAVAGAGYAVLPQELAESAVRRGELIRLSKKPEASFPVYVLYPSRDYVPAKVKAVVEAIVAQTELLGGGA